MGWLTGFLQRCRFGSAPAANSANPANHWAERQAAQFLQSRGLTLVTSNYRCKGGEVDLIMRDRDDLVFVEVRYRRSSRYGSPIATVSGQKQRKLILAAKHYLQCHRLSHKVPCRFDVIGISGSPPATQIDWRSAAFTA